MMKFTELLYVLMLAATIVMMPIIIMLWIGVTLDRAYRKFYRREKHDKETGKPKSRNNETNG